MELEDNSTHDGKGIIHESKPVRTQGVDPKITKDDRVYTIDDVQELVADEDIDTLMEVFTTQRQYIKLHPTMKKSMKKKGLDDLRNMIWDVTRELGRAFPMREARQLTRLCYLSGNSNY